MIHYFALAAGCERKRSKIDVGMDKHKPGETGGDKWWWNLKSIKAWVKKLVNEQ